MSDRKHQGATTLQTVRAEILAGYMDLVRSRGANPSALLERAHINPDQLEDPDNHLSLWAWDKLVSETSVSCNDPLFGFHLAREQPALNMGVAGQLSRSCPDVRSALAVISRYHHLHNEGSSWQVVEEPEYTYLIRREHLRDAKSAVQSALYSMTQGYMILRLLCGQPWSPRAVFFSNSANTLGDIRELKLFFHAPLQFDHEFNGFMVHTETLNRPVSTADPQLHKSLDNYIRVVLDAYGDKSDLCSRVKLLIQQTLSSGRCNAELVASMLSLHPKALQRRLAAEGTGFKALLAEVSIERAQYYMRNTSVSLTEIASFLGYSELSAFTRAYTRQVGVSPSEWREQGTKGSGTKGS